MTRVIVRTAGTGESEGAGPDLSDLVFVIGDESYAFQDEDVPGIVFVTGTEPETELSFNELGSDTETGAADDSSMPTQIGSVTESALVLEPSELMSETGVYSPTESESETAPSPVSISINSVTGQDGEGPVIMVSDTEYQEAVLSRLDSLVFCGTYLFGMMLFLVVYALIRSCYRIIRLFI